MSVTQIEKSEMLSVFIKGDVAGFRALFIEKFFTLPGQLPTDKLAFGWLKFNGKGITTQEYQQISNDYLLEIVRMESLGDESLELFMVLQDDLTTKAVKIIIKKMLEKHCKL